MSAFELRRVEPTRNYLRQVWEKAVDGRSLGFRRMPASAVFRRSDEL
jgi:hypothetical protein